MPLAWYGCVDFGHYHEDRTHIRRVLESAGLVVLGMSDGVLRVCLAEGTAISSVRGHRALGNNRKHTWPWADFLDIRRRQVVEAFIAADAFLSA